MATKVVTTPKLAPVVRAVLFLNNLHVEVIPNPYMPPDNPLWVMGDYDFLTRHTEEADPKVVEVLKKAFGSESK